MVIKTHLPQLLKILALLPTLLLLAGCELLDPLIPPTPAPTPTRPLPPLAVAVDVRDDAIIVPIPREPPSFNAYLSSTGYEALVGELVYGALAEVGPDGAYYPELAAELPTLANGGLSEDGLTVTWRLRDKVYWSDSQPFTSADVRYTWESLRDSGIWSPGSDLIEEVETPDPLTAIVHYRRFYPDYLLQFGGVGTGVFPAHYCGPTNEMLLWDCNLEPISTGPFVLAQWIPKVRLTFMPNPYYYVPDRPLASQIVFELQVDPEIRRRAVERGSAHLDLWPDETTLARTEHSGFNSRIFATKPARQVLRLVPNLSARGSVDPNVPHPILSDLRVRQAIRLAIDTPDLNRKAFNNRGIPVSTELFEVGCEIPPAVADQGLAMALLDASGWKLTDPASPIRRCSGCATAPEGTPLLLKSYTYDEFGKSLQEGHRLLAESLLKVGIGLERHSIEGGVLWAPWSKHGVEMHGNFDLDLWDDGYVGPDPTAYLADYYDPRAIPNRYNPIAGLNISRYYNPKLADIFDALYTPLPENRRRILLCEIATILDEDLPQIPLLAFPDFYLINGNLQNARPHIYDTVTWNAGDWRLVVPPPAPQ
jgi:peptide/nickel transport system substrate-binding protein